MSNCRITPTDLERCEMSSIKKTIVQFLRSCSISDLVHKGLTFEKEDEASRIEKHVPPLVPRRTKLRQLVPKNIKAIAREMNLKEIVYLNLLNNRITQVNGLEELTCLQTLILSFNEIKVIEGFDACLQLRRLELSHNFIKTVGTQLKELVNLRILNLSNNWLVNYSEVENIAKYNTQLSDLYLRCNPLSTKKTYRLQVFNFIGTLLKLDGVTKSSKIAQGLDDQVLMQKPLLHQGARVT